MSNLRTSDQNGPSQQSSTLQRTKSYPFSQVTYTMASIRSRENDNENAREPLKPNHFSPFAQPVFPVRARIRSVENVFFPTNSVTLILGKVRAGRLRFYPKIAANTK
jgi:hypothetical protein